MKLKILLNKKRQHFLNRLKKRNGNILYFLFSKVVDKKNVYDKEGGECLVWKFRNHYFLTQNNKLQTYINKSL